MDVDSTVSQQAATLRDRDTEIEMLEHMLMELTLMLSVEQMKASMGAAAAVQELQDRHHQAVYQFDHDLLDQDSGDDPDVGDHSSVDLDASQGSLTAASALSP